MEVNAMLMFQRLNGNNLFEWSHDYVRVMSSCLIHKLCHFSEALSKYDDKNQFQRKHLLRD